MSNKQATGALELIQNRDNIFFKKYVNYIYGFSNSFPQKGRCTMITKYILSFLIILFPLSINAEPNEAQVNFLRNEANRGDSYSMYRLGKILYESGSINEGLELIKKACVPYEEQYACDYLKSININLNTPSQPQLSQTDELISYYRVEVNKGDSFAMYRLGKILYEKGDKKEGMQLLTKACSDYKETYACMYISNINSKSIPKIPSKDDLISYYRIEVNKGDSFAMYRLGKILYENGDKNEGMQLLTKACSEHKESHACMYINNIASSNTNMKEKPLPVKKRDIFCEYTHVQKQSMGVSNLSAGYSSGVPWLDALNAVAGLIDDAMELIHEHTYICSYSPIDKGQDSIFKRDLDTKDIKYIVFFNGAFKNYYKLYSRYQVYELTISPKTTVDYVGVVDKNNNILRLDAVRGNMIFPATAADFAKIKKYKLEE